MAARLHVNGLATISVGNNVLGWTVDGVTIEFIGYFDDVYTDFAGPHIPTDVLYYGEEAKVTCELIVYDTTVISSIEARVGADAGTNGLYGALMAACGQTYSLTIAVGSNCVSEDEGGWVFGQAYLEGSHTVKVGTRVTRHTCIFRCLPDASGVLFT